MSILGKMSISTFNSIKMRMLDMFWKIQDICYIVGTEIFKIEEEMKEKMKPKVGNPLKQV